VNYVVLGFSLLFEGGSWWVALKEFRKTKGRLGWFQAVRLSKDPSVYTVLFEDSAALLGLLVAFAGISAAEVFDIPEFDGVASLCIGAILGATAIFLARESKGLLLGEPASREVQAKVLAIAQQDAAVQRANGLVSVHIGPEEIIAGLSVEFEDHVAAPEIEACVERIEARLKAEVPTVKSLFVKPQTTRTWERRRQEMADAADDEV
jgi:divalent metal cation (Fe/Co/Zn/Cd) transporter